MPADRRSLRRSRFLVQLAERAEDTGWDGLFLEDYVCYQGDPAA